MSKFKVGDKVILANDNGLDPVNLVLGGIYTIDIISGEFVTLTNGVFSEGCYDYRIELYEEKEKEMTAEQIRDEILRIDARIEEAKKDIENAGKERNSLVEKLREKGFELTVQRATDGGYNVCTVENVKVDDILVLTGDSLNRRIGPGEEVTVIENDRSSAYPFRVINKYAHEDWVFINNVKFKE